MKIAFLIPSLRCGGAERAAAVLSTEWINSGEEVTIVTFGSPTAKPFYDLHPNTKLLQVGLDRVRGSIWERLTKNLRRIVRVRSFFRDWLPHVVVASMERANFVAILAALGLNIPVVVTEHGVPFVADNQNAVEMWLRRLLYPRAARVVVLTQEIAEYYQEKIRVPTVVIPNPVMAEPKLDNGNNIPLKRNGDETRLVALGRLERVKGFDRLLRAMQLVVKERNDIRLTIWGEGAERESLERLRSELSLDKFVALPGRTEDVFEKLRECDIFVMSSLHEAFPNALLEAQAVGLPIISFACPSGPRVIVRNGIDGILVPDGDIQGYAEAILLLANDKERRTAFGRAALEVQERFGLKKVSALWGEILQDVTKKAL